MTFLQIPALRFGALLLALSACGTNETPVPGQRFDILPADVTATTNAVVGINLPAARSNAEWTHVNGASDHSSGHAAFATTPTLRWSVDLGRGVSRNSHISSGPVAANGFVYAMDGDGIVSSVSAGGSVMWSVETTPVIEGNQVSSGGGVTYSNGVIYAGTGFGEVLSIDAASGTINWRRSLDAPIHAAPTVVGKRIFVVTRGDVAYGLSTEDGALEWFQRGAVATLGGIEGGASAAVSGSRVVLPFASGDVMGARTVDGQPQWRTAMDGVTRASSLGFTGDISGDPVIDGGFVYVSSLSGQTLKLQLSNGNKVWEVAAGASDAVWPVGGSIFLVTSEARLLRINARNGQVIWSQQMPAYDNPEKRRGAIRHYGPVLAGGLMWVAGRDGQLRGFAPESGALVSSVRIPNGAAAAPIIVAGVMYILSLDGELHAFQ